MIHVRSGSVSRITFLDLTDAEFGLIRGFSRESREFLRYILRMLSVEGAPPFIGIFIFPRPIIELGGRLSPKIVCFLIVTVFPALVMVALRRKRSAILIMLGLLLPGEKSYVSHIDGGIASFTVWQPVSHFTTIIFGCN